MEITLDVGNRPCSVLIIVSKFVWFLRIYSDLSLHFLFSSKKWDVAGHCVERGKYN